MTPDRVRVWQVDQFPSRPAVSYRWSVLLYLRAKDCEAFHHEVLQIAIGHQLDLIATAASLRT